MSDNQPPNDPFGQTPGPPPGEPLGEPPVAPPNDPYGTAATPPPPPPPPPYQPEYTQQPNYSQMNPNNPYAAGESYGYVPPDRSNYASWGTRAVSFLWDIWYVWPGLAMMLASLIVIGVGAGADSGAIVGLGSLLFFVGMVVAFVMEIMNKILRQGRTGYTYGKAKVGIRTIREDNGQPSGVGSCVGRYLLHAIINQLFYIDYLWPLWDDKCQTITDKILTTIVVHEPEQ